ncbi:MAG: SufS family cysteine desulfurase [Gammaproteobacteria bacterium]|nr:SufS family cysteine desulfurase [Gammaproteobacteria bacterium]MCP5200722.1 SufS family cysteine desulfurase [Gammaproteobacteria bacterium]
MTASIATLSGPAFDVERIRADFPILAREVHGKPLIYVDNAATTQKPQVVIDRIDAYYAHENANIHRGVHSLSAEATAAYEAARETVARFVNARAANEIVFTRGTTEAINLVAQSYARPRLGPDDEILITALEHHSNIVPWQMVCQQTGARLVVAPIDDRGEVVVEEYLARLSPRTRLVAIAHLSNALGTINPLEALIAPARAAGAAVLVDGAQAVVHAPVDVQALDCDFYAFSGHKAFGPTGVGALYGRAELLEAMPPWQGGGDMIKVVSFEGSEYNDIPYKFEAGTPNIAGGLGLAAALDYFTALDLAAVMAHEHALLEAATARARAVPGLRIYGEARHKAAVLSFDIDGAHPQDLGTLLDHHGIAIRTGHHCAMPVMQRFGIAGTARVSFALYNTQEEVERIFDALERVRTMLVE